MCYQIFLEIEYHSKPDQDSELGAAVVFFFFLKRKKIIYKLFNTRKNRLKSNKR